MGGLPRATLHTHCACCEDGIVPDIGRHTKLIPIRTLRRIGLCQQCLMHECYCVDLDELCDNLMDLECEYEGKMDVLKVRIKQLEDARLRGTQHLRKARAP